MSTSADQSSASQAGKESNKPLYDPWERIAPLPSEPAAGAPKRAKRVLRDPWEVDPTLPQPKQVSDAPRPQNEAQMRDAVKLSQAEQIKSQKYETSDANIRELENEIRKTKSPENRKILQAELDRLLQMRK